MVDREQIARAIDPGAWNLKDRMASLVVKDPFHRSKIDMSLAAADRVLALSDGEARG